ncbi:polyprenyl synthetase family protein [Planomonospora sp. ID67723]|uniref:polyprenyl synthetase family protein n=1 Tax=Planomonospora sp. ID67723 TaxID=2738134 RepID=UPI0018C41562|nr:polyprenyl synthetase family protein [Planomonospora sp. ID67723]MBG0832629.1 polyprenyl synthetase family protein [Planomonospora sp. ID67723]
MTAEVVETSVARIIDRVRRQVDDRLVRFLDAHLPPVDDPDVVEGYRLLREFVVDGGKRIRPILCYWGWRGAGGEDHGEEPAICAGAALELCHAGLLIHDDIMDGSDLRRGRPTIHRNLAGSDRQPADRGFGNSAAILLGVLAQAWADELLGEVGVDEARTRAVRMLFYQMRMEVISGQYLDLLARIREDAGVDHALTVIRYKTAKYTVERPLQIGGALAGAEPPLLEAYSRFGLPLGEAFQLRDDILGVFGDTATTGKPVVDDLREGKQTVLIAQAFDRARGPQRDQLRAWYGNPDLDERHTAVLRQVIVDTGALAHVESLIARRVDEALGTLRDGAIPAQAREALTLLTGRLTDRVL